MCNNDDQAHRNCINWSDDLKSFWVSNIETFSRMILPMYFKHNNYASFVRQLNMYGFHRSTEPRGKVVPGAAMIEHFTHPYFIKGRDDLLVNIHRKTSSGMKAKRGAGGKAAAAGVGFAQKEARHMQQMMMEHEEKIMQVMSDVEVLKKNQMQLANTIQAMHSQSVAMQTEVAVSADKLDALIRALAMHNVEIDSPGDGARDREGAREEAVLAQSRRLQESMLSPSADMDQHDASGYGDHGDLASFDFEPTEDVHGDDGMEPQGMEFDALFGPMEGDSGSFDPLY